MADETTIHESSNATYVTLGHISVVTNAVLWR